MEEKIQIASLADVVEFTKAWCGDSNKNRKMLGQMVVLDENAGSLTYLAQTEIDSAFSNSGRLLKSERAINEMNQRAPGNLKIIKPLVGEPIYTAFIPAIGADYLLIYDVSGLEKRSSNKMDIVVGTALNSSRTKEFELKQLEKIGLDIERIQYRFRETD